MEEKMRFVYLIDGHPVVRGRFLRTVNRALTVATSRANQYLIANAVTARADRPSFVRALQPSGPCMRTLKFVLPGKNKGITRGHEAVIIYLGRG